MEENKPMNNQGSFRVQIKQKKDVIKRRTVKTWTTEEDQQLLVLYNEYPKKWAQIAANMTDRNENQCLHRYRRLLQAGSCKKIWSSSEDKTVLNLIKKVGKNWKVIAEIIGTKTGKQIRERFINKLDPKIKNTDWTEDEDKLIAKYYSELGSKWSEISKMIPGRPENKIKNRFYSFIQRNYEINFTQLKSNENDESTEKQNIKQQIKQVNILGQQNCDIKNQKEDKNKSQQKKGKQLVSIKQIEEEQVIGVENGKDQIFDSNVNISNKYGLNLSKQDEEYIDAQHRYRSIKSLISNNQMDNENDFFYFGNNWQ